MVIILGADHAGWRLKNKIKDRLSEKGIAVKDLGTNSDTSVDYPDYGKAVGEAVAAGEGELGILVCGSGIGLSIAANKVKGIRAALCTDGTMGRLAREHNDANVLVLGERITGELLALDIAEAFLSANFLGGRHQRRVDKINALDED